MNTFTKIDKLKILYFNILFNPKISEHQRKEDLKRIEELIKYYCNKFFKVDLKRPDCLELDF